MKGFGPWFLSGSLVIAAGLFFLPDRLTIEIKLSGFPSDLVRMSNSAVQVSVDPHEDPVIVLSGD